MLLRICITCDRYGNRTPSSGERLAQMVAHGVALRHELDVSILRVACLNGCKNACQVMLTGRDPVRIGNLRPEDASFLVDIAAVYWSGGDVIDIMSVRSSSPLS